MTVGRSTTCVMVLGLVLAASLPVRAQPELPLPTPRSHYETFTPGLSGLPLLQALTKGLDPQAQQAGLTLVTAFRLGNLGSTAQSKEQSVARLKGLNWRPWKPLLLEFAVHQSQAVELVPETSRAFFFPIVHDALLYFLDHLPEDRLLEKLVDIANLPPGRSRGAAFMAFVAKTPSLQKLGQILARNEALSPEYRDALQQLENEIHTMTRDELIQFIADDMRKNHIATNQVEFADAILAEASVGAVIRATWTPTGTHETRDAICKVIKPYVLVNLPQELEILDGLARYFADNHDFYQLGTMPLVEMFQEVKRALSKEIQVVDEQQNLMRARQYYKANRHIVVPELLPISTNHITFMEYIPGEKITSAFEGQPAERAVMARRLADVMTRDVIFASNTEPIFHGDPHAGNVFHATGNPNDPYQIALLDWGLYGTFPRDDRVALMQLILGVQLKDAKRLHDHVGGLLVGGLPEDPQKCQRVDAIIARVLQPTKKRTSFEAIEELLVNLIDEGYATKFSLNLFVKSQITMTGILTELDPAFDQDRYLSQRLRSLVKQEIPKRLLCTIWFPAWNSRNYRSLLSNGDVLAARRIPK